MNMPRRLTVVPVVLIIVFLLAAVIADYFVNTKPQKQLPIITAPHAVNLVSLTSLIKGLGVELQVAFPDLELEATPAQVNPVGYQLAGYPFKVLLPVSGDSLTYTNRNGTDSETAQFTMLTKALPTVDTYLKNNNFSPQARTPSSDDFLSTVYFYKDQTDICQVTVYTELDVVCAPLSQLKQIAQQAQPLVQAYTAASPITSETIVATPTIRASQTAGYTIATLAVYSSVGQTNVNYYKQANSGWQLVNLSWYNDPNQDADIEPNCEAFESLSAVRLAFAGVACYDSSLRLKTIIH
jgi:hypothetical protein